MKGLFLSLCIFNFLLAGYAQNFSEKMLSIQWDNDMPVGQDQYYTNGFHFSLISPELNGLFIKQILLPKKKETIVFHGLSVSQEIYTPDAYLSRVPLHNDRPYASALYATFFNINSIPSSHFSYKSEIVLGVIGPFALGKDVQVGWHELINAHVPRGWDSQMNTDLILNYNIELQKGLINDENLSVILFNKTQMGTYKINTQLGSKITIGIFNDKFSSLDVSKNSSKNWLANLEFQIQSSIIGYDATMQGGLLNNKNVISFDANYIERLTHSGTFALNIGFNNLLLTTSLTSLSPEFKGGKKHGYGTIKFSIAI